MNPRQRRHLKYSLNCSYLINFQRVHHSRLRKKSKQNPASSPPPPGHYIKIIFYKIRLYKQGKSFFCLVSLDNNYDKKISDFSASAGRRLFGPSRIPAKYPSKNRSYSPRGQAESPWTFSRLPFCRGRSSAETNNMI